MVDRYVCACPPGYYRQKPEITNEKIVKNEKEEGKKNEGTCVKIYYKSIGRNLPNNLFS